jgi:hypothetical protein
MHQLCLVGDSGVKKTPAHIVRTSYADFTVSPQCDDFSPVALPTAAEDYPEGRLLRDPRATKAILQFLSGTTIGAPGRKAQALDRAHADGEWGLEALEDAVGDGEGQ